MFIKKIIKIFEEVLIIFLKGLIVFGGIGLNIYGVKFFLQMFGISISLQGISDFFNQLNYFSGFITILLVGLIVHYTLWKTK